MLVRNGHVLSEKHRIQKAYRASGHGAGSMEKWKMEYGTKQGSRFSRMMCHQGRGRRGGGGVGGAEGEGEGRGDGEGGEESGGRGGWGVVREE